MFFYKTHLNTLELSSFVRFCGSSGDDPMKLSPAVAHLQQVGPCGLKLKSLVKMGLVALAILIGTAILGWALAAIGTGADFLVFAVGLVLSVLLVHLTLKKPNCAVATAWLLPVAIGLATGGLTAIADKFYPGLVFWGIGLPVMTYTALLCAYLAGVDPDQDIKLMGISAFFGLLFMTVLTALVGGGNDETGSPGIPRLWDLGPFGWLGVLGVLTLSSLLYVRVMNYIEICASEESEAKSSTNYVSHFAVFALSLSIPWAYIRMVQMAWEAIRREIEESKVQTEPSGEDNSDETTPDEEASARDETHADGSESDDSSSPDVPVRDAPPASDKDAVTAATSSEAEVALNPEDGGDNSEKS